MTREMTFEEEYTILQKEATELFDKEDEESEVFPTMGSKNVTATTIVWINS